MPPPPHHLTELVHKGYGAQLRVETVPEWAKGYIGYDDLMKAVEAIRDQVASGTSATVNNATTVLNDLMISEISRSAIFFANEITIAALRLKEITGNAPLVALEAGSRHCDAPPSVTPHGRFKSPAVVKLSTPQHRDAMSRTPSKTSVRSRATTDSDDSDSDAASSLRRRSSVNSRKSSRMSKILDPYARAEMEARRIVTVPLRELQITVDKLFRFADVQKKTLRHVLDEANNACPTGRFDDTEIQLAWEDSALVTELGTLTQLGNAVKAEMVIAGGAPVDATAQGASSAAEAYDWVIKWHFVVLAMVVLTVLAIIPIFSDNREAHNCAAIIGCVTVLWVTEAMPYFATAMLIPLLAVPMNVLPGLDHKATAKELLGTMFNDTQVLVLGGLCMGKAISKHHLEQVVARVLLRRVASRPALYLLVMMVLSALLCSVISNVAAPVLVMSVVQPSLWELPEDSGAPQAILLAIAFACNFGGMLTPIASPQNAVAQDSLGSDTISFGSWMGAALPIVAVGLLSTWVLVLVIWKPFENVSYIPMPLAKGFEGDAEAKKDRPPRVLVPHRLSRHSPKNTEEDDTNGREMSREHLTGMPAVKTESRDDCVASSDDDADGDDRPSLNFPARLARREKIMTVIVVCVTVALLCIPQDDVLGSTGAVALIPIVCFFGVGVLTKADFNSLSWHLIFLLSGGNMLGDMADKSQLLNIVIEALRPFLEQHSTYQVVAVLIASVALVTTFVSHTVAALLLMPVIVRISSVNPSLPSAQALVFLSVIMCSGSMAFPITSFPNVNSLLTEARDGRQYLLARHFLIPGMILSAMVMVQLMTYMVPVADGVMHGNSTMTNTSNTSTVHTGLALFPQLVAPPPLP